MKVIGPKTISSVPNSKLSDGVYGNEIQYLTSSSGLFVYHPKGK